MKNPIIPKPLFLALIIGALLLPMAIIVVLGVGYLLSAMGDLSGGIVLSRIGLALGILWILNLIVLVVAVAMHSLDDDSQQS